MSESGFACPLPLLDYPHVSMAHGGGGRLMRQLIASLFAAEFGGETETDSAIVPVSGDRLAFTTDSFVVKPLFFPGGDIGSLAVHGTVNDLAVSGAAARVLSAGFILEEGLHSETLQRVVRSMARAAREAGVRIVTGDTKVVERGKADGLYINTSGIGFFDHPFRPSPDSIAEGDAILVSGDIGRHGMAIMSCREGLEFESPIESDSAPVSAPIAALFQSRCAVHCLRDLTRGGLASALVELSQSCGLSFRLEEKSIPVREDVRAACEILGFDPLYVANEGRFVCLLPAPAAEQALEVLKRFDVSRGAAVVGRVEAGPARVRLQSVVGGVRLIDLLSGEQLPRIC